MTTPEPLDEELAPRVEVRGGNREADWNQPLPFIEEDLRRVPPDLPVDPDDYICSCGDQDCELK
jgi:hypothetical protein